MFLSDPMAELVIKRLNRAANRVARKFKGRVSVDEVRSELFSEFDRRSPAGDPTSKQRISMRIVEKEICRKLAREFNRQARQVPYDTVAEEEVRDA